MFSISNPDICDNFPQYSSCKKRTIFILMFLLDVVDLVSDWCLYRDVSITEKGLAYGPPDDVLVRLLLAFSIIGSLTFVCEVVNMWFYLFKDNPWIDIDLMSAITTWIEDVPQIVINVVIASCREEAISYFQLVKAFTLIVGAIIRVAITITKYCSKRALCELQNVRRNQKYTHHVIYRVIVVIGVITTLAGSITVCIFTLSDRNPDGSINFKDPHSEKIREYNDQKYFDNVSIFFSHPLFDKDKPTVNEVNWVRMATIYDVRKTDEDVFFHIKYDNNTRQKIGLSLINGTSVSQNCFKLDRTTGSMTHESNCTSFLQTGSYLVELIFKFHYRNPEPPKLIFGDIKYNMIEKENNNCNSPSITIYDDVVKRLSDTQNAAMHYFRTKPGVQNNHHVLVSGGNVQYYHADNLIDISEVWRTGIKTCKSTGSPAPHRDSNIDVGCK